MQSIFLYWTVNNIISLLQFKLFLNPTCRRLLGIMPHRAPKNPTGVKPREGIYGLLLDRIEFVKMAFRNFLEDADQRRKSYDVIGKDKGAVTYETRSKQRPDSNARRAQLVEKLK